MLTPHAIGIEVGRLGKVWVFDGLERRDALGRVVVEETLDEIDDGSNDIKQKKKITKKEKIIDQ